MSDCRPRPTGITNPKPPKGDAGVPLARGRDIRHHPTIYTTGAHGNWCECSCGWKSHRWQQVGGAHLEFGQHLREAK